MTPWPVWQGFELICLRNSFEIEPWKSSHCQTLPWRFLEVGLQTLERLRWKHKLQWAAVVHAGAGCCCSFTANRCHLLSFMFTQPSADPTRSQTYIWQYENGGPALSPPPSHPSAKNTSTQHAALPHCCHWIHCQHDAGSLLFGYRLAASSSRLLARVWIIGLCLLLSVTFTVFTIHLWILL